MDLMRRRSRRVDPEEDVESGVTRGGSAPATVRAKAQAVPGERVGPNPFWDERHQDEFRLQLARPADLPTPEEGAARGMTQMAGSLPFRPPQGEAGSSAGDMGAQASSSAAIALPDGSLQDNSGGEGQVALRHAQTPPRELAPAGLQVALVQDAAPAGAQGVQEVDLATPKSEGVLAFWVVQNGARRNRITWSPGCDWGGWTRCSVPRDVGGYVLREQGAPQSDTGTRRTATTIDKLEHGIGP